MQIQSLRIIVAILLTLVIMLYFYTNREKDYYSKSAEPKEGWPKYINFLVDQISYSEYDTGKPVVGETIVSFDLNSNAEPINFTFVKEIDTDVNHAIEEMITNGPDWKLTDKTALPATIKLKLNF